MHRRDVGRLERVGEHGDLHARALESGQFLHSLLTRHEVGGDQLELAFRAVHDFLESIPEHSVVRRAREAFGGVVAHHVHVRPLEPQIALEQVAYKRRAGDGMDVFHTDGIVLDALRGGLDVHSR